MSPPKRFDLFPVVTLGSLKKSTGGRERTLTLFRRRPESREFYHVGLLKHRTATIKELSIESFFPQPLQYLSGSHLECRNRMHPLQIGADRIT